VADPLTHLAAPSPSGLTNYGAVTVSGTSSKSLSPGIYSQISISGSATVTLNPGMYTLERGGLTVSGLASLTGNGILIYNTGSKYPSAGGNYGAITLSGSGTVKLSAATTGVYAGIVIDQDPNDMQTLALSGTAVAVTGTVYAPKAPLVLSGSAQLNATLDVDLLTMSGSAVDSTSVGGGALAGGRPDAVPVIPLATFEAVVPLAGNRDNLIAPRLGQHIVHVGNSSNILIDGTVTLTQSGDTLRQVLSDWISYGATAANVANIRKRLQVTDNTSHANTLLASSGLDWFWETYARDTTNRKATDLLN
jgi:hypothetical protein